MAMPLKVSAKACGVLLAAVVVFVGTTKGSETTPKPPQLTSSYPLVIERGKSAEIAFRGTHLTGATGVWSECGAFHAKILDVREVPTERKESEQEQGPKEAPPPNFEVRVALDAAPTAGNGVHALRLYSPHGVSNPVAVFVVDSEVIREVEEPHEKPEHAQEIKSPALISGRLSADGEIDYYSLRVAAGQRLQMEVATGGGLIPSAPAPFVDPALIVYEDSGSWFDPGRLRQVELTDESFFFFAGGSIVAQHRPRFTHRFAESGRFYVAVKAVSGKGSPDHGYQLRVLPADPPMLSSGQDRWITHTPACESPGEWNERIYGRELRADRLQRLAARSVWPADAEKNDGTASDSDVAGPWQHGTGKAPGILVATEQEPNDDQAQALALNEPSIIAGTIGHAADIDLFRLSVRRGDKLALELQLPELAPPYFNPRLTVLTASGETFYDNIYRKIGGDGDDWIKSVEPKMIVTFDEEGSYYVQVRDLTQRRSGPLLQYRLLVRPQTPHVGEVSAKTFNESGGEQSIDTLNLSPGETRKITMITALEEGFQGEVAFSLDGLPPGVETFPSASEQHEIPSHPGETREVWGADGKERFRPLRLATTLILTVRPDAPPTAMPQAVKVMARPVVDGQLGPAISGPEILLMIVQDRNQAPVAWPPAAPSRKP